MGIVEDAKHQINKILPFAAHIPQPNRGGVYQIQDKSYLRISLIPVRLGDVVSKERYM
jgi:hypothetical protein